MSDPINPVAPRSAYTSTLSLQLVQASPEIDLVFAEPTAATAEMVNAVVGQKGDKGDKGVEGPPADITALELPIDPVLLFENALE